MANSAVVKNYWKGVSDFWLGAIQRFDDARALAEQGKYKSDNLASDLAFFWFKSIDAWFSPWPAVGEPTLPTVYIDTPATGSNNQAGTAYLASSVSVGTNVKVTTLYMLGTTDTLAAKAEMDPADPTLLKVTLTAAGKAGVYQGLVHTDGAVKPLAVVFARLT